MKNDFLITEKPLYTGPLGGKGEGPENQGIRKNRCFTVLKNIGGKGEGPVSRGTR